MDRRTFISIVIAAPLAARTARATLYVALPSDALLARADVVTLARVVDVTPEWQSGRIMSRALLAGEETFKGAHAQSRELLVPGGTIDGIAMRVAGYPTVRAGERAVLLLARANGAHRIVGASAGKLDVRAGARGDVVLVPSADGASLARVPMDDFKRSLHAAIERRGT